jgi:hypothetical protein
MKCCPCPIQCREEIDAMRVVFAVWEALGAETERCN